MRLSPDLKKVLVIFGGIKSFVCSLLTLIAGLVSLTTPIFAIPAIVWFLVSGLCVATLFGVIYWGTPETE